MAKDNKPSGGKSSRRGPLAHFRGRRVEQNWQEEGLRLQKAIITQEWSLDPRFSLSSPKSNGVDLQAFVTPLALARICFSLGHSAGMMLCLVGNLGGGKSCG